MSLFVTLSYCYNGISGANSRNESESNARVHRWNVLEIQISIFKRENGLASFPFPYCCIPFQGSKQAGAGFEWKASGRISSKTLTEMTRHL